eukprot:gene14280-15767_t
MYIIPKSLIVLVVMIVQCGHVACSTPVKCQLIDVIEESDPFNRVLEPAYKRTKKCIGGTKSVSRYQCQPKQTETRQVTFFDTHNLKWVTRPEKVPLTCAEFCVCHMGCAPGEEVKKGLCQPGYIWDAPSCSCRCSKPNVGPLTAKEKTVSLKHHILTLVILTIVAVVILALIVWKFRRDDKQSNKYRFLSKVQWDDETKTLLKNYYDSVDGPRKKEKRSNRWCCCNDDEDETVVCEAGQFDETDAGPNQTAKELFVQAFEQGNSEEMLGYLTRANDELEQSSSNGKNNLLKHCIKFVHLAQRDVAAAVQVDSDTVVRSQTSPERSNGNVSNYEGARLLSHKPMTD